MSLFCSRIPTQGLTLHLAIISPWSPLVPLCLRLYLFVIDLTESRKVVFALVFPCQLALSPFSYPIFREQVPKSSSHSMRIRVRDPRERTIYLYYLEFFCKQIFPLLLYLVVQALVYMNMDLCILILYWDFQLILWFIVLLNLSQPWPLNAPLGWLPHPWTCPIICFLSTSLLSEHCEVLQALLAHLLLQI